MKFQRGTPNEPTPPADHDQQSGVRLRNLMLLVVLVALLLAAAIQLGSVGLIILLLMFGPAVLIVGVVVLLVRRRQAEQEALLRFLAIAAERGMPLSPGIEACAELCGWGFRRRALALARRLEAGLALPEALQADTGLLPRPAPLLARVGWAVGAPATALREALAALSARRAYRTAFAPRLAYLVCLLLAMQMLLGFVFYFIIPKFEAIFADFGTRLPPLTLGIIWSSHLLMKPFGLPLLVLVELAALLYLAALFAGRVRWEPPPLPWLLRRRDTAAVLRALAVGVESGRPLDAVFTTLAADYPRAAVRRRLEATGQKIAAGSPWTDALRSAGLIGTHDAALLDAAARAGNLAWALRTLADAHERRLGYRLAAATQFLFPVAVLGLGLLVGLYVVALFVPLVHLIHALAW